MRPRSQSSRRPFAAPARPLLALLLAAPLALAALTGCSADAEMSANTADSGASAQGNPRGEAPPHDYEVELTEEQWRKVLGPQEFHVLREDGTERAFTGDLLDNKEDGVYVCAACGQALFDSRTKFESGTGWPSFYTFVDGAIDSERDTRYGMVRTEVVCSRCGSHQGHVFEDGPEPTGLRYCINAVSLDFVPRAEWEAQGEDAHTSAVERITTMTETGSP